MSLQIACISPQVKVFGKPEIKAQRVAILPFTCKLNHPESVKPDKILRLVFYNHFSYLAYLDMPLDEVDERLLKAGYKDPNVISRLDANTLKKILGVDAVIRGHVKDANNFTGGVYAETRIDAKMQLSDLNQKKTVWEVEHHEINMAGVASPSLLSIIEDQIDNSKEGLAYALVADTYSNAILDRIPDPARSLAQNVKPPQIIRVEAKITHRGRLKAGDQIHVHLTGDAGLKASFDVGNSLTHIPMQETRPGSYRGHYTIQQNDRIARSLVIGRLKNKQGLISKKIVKTPVPPFNV